MSGEQVVVGLDVGTTKISALIGEVKSLHQVAVVGVGISQSKGLKKGLVVDMEETAANVTTALKKAEAFSGYKIIGAYVSVSGAHLLSEEVRGAVSMGGGRSVSQQELSEVLRAARLGEVPEGRDVLHVLPKGYVVDGEDGIRNPIGMLASRLEVEGLVVSSSSAPLRNLARCVERAGIKIDGFVAGGLASSQGVLSEPERKLGVLLMDLGGGTTDLTWYRDGVVQCVGALPIGGNHLTNDLSVGLGVPFSAAEEIKVRFASAAQDMVDEEDVIDVGAISDGSVRKVSRRFIAEIVEARLSEIFSLASGEIEKQGFRGVLPAGVVLTGGTAQLRGIRDLAAKSFDSPVRVGLPDGLSGSIDSISGSAYAAGAGLLKWAMAQTEELPAARSPRRRDGWGSRVKSFVKAFLP